MAAKRLLIDQERELDLLRDESEMTSSLAVAQLLPESERATLSGAGMVEGAVSYTHLQQSERIGGRYQGGFLSSLR